MSKWHCDCYLLLLLGCCTRRGEDAADYSDANVNVNTVLLFEIQGPVWHVRLLLLGCRDYGNATILRLEIQGAVWYVRLAVIVVGTEISRVSKTCHLVVVVVL